MRSLPYGRERIDVDIKEDALVLVHRQVPAPPVADLASAIRIALEAPLRFPPLRRALTPDDHIAIVLDEHLPRLAELLMPVFDHIVSAGVAPAAITLLTTSSGADQSWINDLPEAFEDVRLETHNPKDRHKLSYLATTRAGRRLYVNRTVVDADHLILLCRPDVDPELTRGGAGLLYPALGDEAAREAHAHSQASPRLLREEATEVAWLLGAPFLVQIIEGAGDDIAHVVGGLVETSAEGEQLYTARWKQTVAQRADTVVATVCGDPGRHDFADLARALAHAAKVVQPEGRIIVLSQAAPRLGRGADLLRQGDTPGQALVLLRQNTVPDLAAAVQWAIAAQRARIYLLSGLPADVAEELFVTPMDHAGQLQRLLQSGGSYLLLEDADKVLPVMVAEEKTGE
jgi:nickel-dependent lactate racemase